MEQKEMASVELEPLRNSTEADLQKKNFHTREKYLWVKQNKLLH